MYWESPFPVYQKPSIISEIWQLLWTAFAAERSLLVKKSEVTTPHRSILLGVKHTSMITFRRSDAQPNELSNQLWSCGDSQSSYLHLLLCSHNKYLQRTFLLECKKLLWGHQDGFAMTRYYSVSISPSNKNVPRRSSPHWDNLQHDEVQLCAA